MVLAALSYILLMRHTEVLTCYMILEGYLLRSGLILAADVLW